MKGKIKMRIIAATQNKGKIKEIQDIFGGLGFSVISQKEAGIDIDVEETGKTFEENALIKARAIFNLCHETVVSDDSGLCVESLNGAPGVYSARYAGEGASDADRINKLLGELEGKDNRSAKFVSAVAMILKDGREITASGEVEGEITKEPSGDNGFGYDPVFYSYELKKTFGEAGSSEKNEISHRARALKKLYEKVSGKIG